MTARWDEDSAETRYRDEARTTCRGESDEEAADL